MPPASLKNPSMFDLYAHEYDILTDAVAREPNHDQEVAALIERFQPKRVLDAGCATGLTTMLFARRGIKTVGIDRSRPMIEQARKKHADSDLDMEFKVAEFQKIPKSLHGSFDLIVCLANSIAGLETRNHLQQGLKCFRDALMPNGSLVIQMLNFAAISEGQLFPIKATVNHGIIWQRFFERQKTTYILYATRCDIHGSPPTLEVFRHKFDNFTRAEVIKYLKFSRFKSLETYDDLKLSKPYDKRTRDLVIVAKKGE